MLEAVDPFCESRATGNEEHFQGLDQALKKLNKKRKRTVKRIRALADELDALFFKCKTASATCSGLSVISGVTAVAAAVIGTGGAAFIPLSICSLGAGAVGLTGKVASDVGLGYMSSIKVEEFEKAMKKDKVAFKAMKSELRMLISQVDNASKAIALLSNARCFFGSDHPVNRILHSLLDKAMVNLDHQELKYLGIAEKANSLLIMYAEAASKSAGERARKKVLKKAAKETTKKGLDEAGKAAVQEAAKIAGEKAAKRAAKKAAKEAAKKITIGVNGIGMVISGIEMGLDLQALMSQEGSDTAKALREKADDLEDELELFCKPRGV